MGVVSAALLFFGIKFENTMPETTQNILGLVMYAAIICFLIVFSLKAKKDE